MGLTSYLILDIQAAVGWNERSEPQQHCRSSSIPFVCRTIRAHDFSSRLVFQPKGAAFGCHLQDKEHLRSINS